jgi:hypothetical protein
MKIEIVENTNWLCVAYSVKYQGKETFDCFAWFGEKKDGHRKVKLALKYLRRMI